jgi:uncharacterized damage-inducible protein DinB
MKSAICVALGVFVAGSLSMAQAPGGGQKLSLAQTLQRSYNGIKANMTEAAAQMSDAEYSYRPSPEIRTYAGQIGHVAFWNYNFCAAAKGEPSPNKDMFETTKTTKADVEKVLAESFAYCDPVFASLTDENAMQLVKQGQNEVPRVAPLINVLTHGNEEYGIMTVYLRTKNMVPPSTERAMKGRAAKK